MHMNEISNSLNLLSFLGSLIACVGKHNEIFLHILSATLCPPGVSLMFTNECSGTEGPAIMESTQAKKLRCGNEDQRVHLPTFPHQVLSEEAGQVIFI